MISNACRIIKAGFRRVQMSFSCVSDKNVILDFSINNGAHNFKSKSCDLPSALYFETLQVTKVGNRKYDF